MILFVVRMGSEGSSATQKTRPRRPGFWSWLRLAIAVTGCASLFPETFPPSGAPEGGKVSGKRLAQPVTAMARRSQDQKPGRLGLVFCVAELPSLPILTTNSIIVTETFQSAGEEWDFTNSARDPMMGPRRGGLVARVMAKAKILIADDESTSRRGLQELLGSWGYEVAAAADGEEALEKASEFRPALVITDLVMPKMEGLA